jgi:hypothetical protein
VQNLAPASKDEEILWMFNIKVYRKISESKRGSERRMEMITQEGIHNSYLHIILL